MNCSALTLYDANSTTARIVVPLDGTGAVTFGIPSFVCSITPRQRDDLQAATSVYLRIRHALNVGTTLNRTVYTEGNCLDFLPASQIVPDSMLPFVTSMSVDLKNLTGSLSFSETLAKTSSAVMFQLSSLTSSFPDQLVANRQSDDSYAYRISCADRVMFVKAGPVRANFTRSAFKDLAGNGNADESVAVNITVPGKSPFGCLLHNI